MRPAAAIHPVGRKTICDGPSSMSRIGDRGEMEAFVRAVERGSFSAAARDFEAHCSRRSPRWLRGWSPCSA